jgi:hypothetical protein
MIDKSSFYALKKDGTIIDASGQKWIVTENHENVEGSSDVPGEREVTVVDPDNHEWILGWSDAIGKIVDEEHAEVLDLNHPDACIEGH